MDAIREQPKMTAGLDLGDKYNLPVPHRHTKR
jgi:hypothetical protein